MRNAKTLAIVVALGLGLIFLYPFVAQAKKAPKESQAGGLPALEDRVEADEALITALQGQNNWAVVASNGTLARGHTDAPGGVTSSRITTGQYEVDFGTPTPKDVSACAYVATLGDTASAAPPVGEISVASDGDGVFVETFNSSGTATDAPFHLYVSCP